jgi:prepilin-type N-terminal cleavage/methylation domain-containing protein
MTSPTERVAPRIAGRSAFSLVELLIVLALMAILIGGVAVSLQGREGDVALRLAGDDVAMAMRFAASQARQTGLSHRIVFHQDQSFWVESLVMVPGGGGWEWIAVAGMAGLQRQLPKGIVVTGHRRSPDNGGENANYVFSPAGAEFVRPVELMNEGFAIVQISVLPATGQVVSSLHGVSP